MIYRIRYYKNGDLIGSTPWSSTLEKAQKVARDGLIRHSADQADIIQDGTNEPVIWSTAKK